MIDIYGAYPTVDLDIPDLRHLSLAEQIAGLTSEMWKWLLNEKSYSIYHHQQRISGGWKSSEIVGIIEEFNYNRIRQLAEMIRTLKSLEGAA